jgi:hypothetical protein
VDRLQDCAADQYWNRVGATLDNPVDVWENPFTSQLDDFGRGATLLVVLNRIAMSEEELAESYARYLSRPENGSLQGKRDLLATLRHLSGSMLNRVAQGNQAGNVWFGLFNPSIGDYVLRRYSRNVPALQVALLCLRSRSSVETVVSLYANNFISQDAAESLLTRLLDEVIGLGFVGYSAEYVAQLCVSLRTFGKLQDCTDGRLAPAIKFVVSSECPSFISPSAQIVRLGIDLGLVDSDAAQVFVEDACSQSPTDNELALLAKVVQAAGLSSESSAFEALATATSDYLVEAVHDEFDDGDVFDGVDFEDYFGAERNLRRLIGKKLSNLEITIDDLSKIVSAYDIHERHNSYFEPEPEYERRGVAVGSNLELDEIDDLFQRPG